jgi:hypothetical protein
MLAVVAMEAGRRAPAGEVWRTAREVALWAWEMTWRAVARVVYGALALG